MRSRGLPIFLNHAFSIVCSTLSMRKALCTSLWWHKLKKNMKLSQLPRKRQSSYFICMFSVSVSGQYCPDEEGTFYFPDSDYCDRYKQCRDGVATEQQCPNGLLYNDRVESGRYPCDYPADVDCGGRSKTREYMIYNVVPFLIFVRSGDAISR